MNLENARPDQGREAQGLLAKVRAELQAKSAANFHRATDDNETYADGYLSGLVDAVQTLDWFVSAAAALPSDAGVRPTPDAGLRERLESLVSLLRESRAKEQLRAIKAEGELAAETVRLHGLLDAERVITADERARADRAEAALAASPPAVPGDTTPGEDEARPSTAPPTSSPVRTLLNEWLGRPDYWVADVALMDVARQLQMALDGESNDEALFHARLTGARDALAAQRDAVLALCDAAEARTAYPSINDFRAALTGPDQAGV